MGFPHTQSGRRGPGNDRFRRSSPRRSIRSFDPSHLVRKASGYVAPPYVSTMHFSDYPFSATLQENIRRHGYDRPTQIQEEIIPHILAGKDVVGLANTGTGKTAAFLLPLLELLSKFRSTRVLIIAPTRELAVQIDDEFRALARDLGLYSTICIGGVAIGPQMNRLRRDPHVVIGTPGRLKDLEQQRALDFSRFGCIVLDEVDQMLDMGFIHDVTYITSKLSTPRHSLFFSATMTDSVKSVMRDFLQDPVTVSVKTQDTADTIDQDVIHLNGKPKIDVLHELLVREDFEKVLVFSRTKWGTERIAEALDKRGVAAVTIHGNKSQGQRQRAIEQFKRNITRVLVATDVAARGLDIDHVTHVINFDLPESYEDYIHRIGRTGRAGRKGTALSFIEHQ